MHFQTVSPPPTAWQAWHRKFCRPSLTPAGCLLLALAALLLWDGSGADWPLAQWMGGARHFPLRENFWLRQVLHDGAQALAWLALLALWGLLWQPAKIFAALPALRRVQLALAPLLAAALVAWLKARSSVSCPWALIAFGGSAPDGVAGAGRCFPAGHASAGFAFAAGWVALRRHMPALARIWLAAALAAGVLLGLVQQWRGAHFMSHTLWTAWLCMAAGWALDAAFSRWQSLHRLWQRARSGDAGVPLWQAALAASVWMALAGNAPLWQRLHALGLLDAAQGKLMAAGIFILLVCMVMALLSLLAWRVLFKPATSALLLISALVSHFCTSYGVLMSPDMLRNVVQTDVGEAAALLNAALLWHLAWQALLPAALLWCVRLRYAPLRRSLWQQPLHGALCLLLAAAVLWGMFQPFALAMRQHKDVRYLLNPLAALYSLARVALQDGQQAVQALQPVGDDAWLGSNPDGHPKLLLLVVGESARSANIGLNGYERDTTPALRRAGAISFTGAMACGTSTAESLPCMFSHLPRAAYAKNRQKSESLLDVLQKAGLAVFWLNNQSGCKGVCDRVPHADAHDGSAPSACQGLECMDGQMLDGLDARLAALPAERRARGMVVVLHQMGSHGPAYHLRSPGDLKQYLPECDSIALANCPRQSLVNAYDNSILYTDHFLGRAIDWLQTHQGEYDTALLYVSDHGESLGENNLYLHGMPWALAPQAQKHIAWIAWFAAQWPQWPAAEGTQCLLRRRNAPISHDHYFHSVLGLMQVQTGLYEEALDMFAPCRAGGAAFALHDAR